MPVIKQEICFLEVPDIVTIASQRTFCAGFLNKTKSVCSGEAGGGFCNFDFELGLFNIKGIVSASLMDSFGCNRAVYAVYTHVVKYLDWINIERYAKKNKTM